MPTASLNDIAEVSASLGGRTARLDDIAEVQPTAPTVPLTQRATDAGRTAVEVAQSHAIKSLGGPTIGELYDKVFPPVNGKSGFEQVSEFARRVGRTPAELVDFALTPFGALTIATGGVGGAAGRAAVGAGFGTAMGKELVPIPGVPGSGEVGREAVEHPSGATIAEAVKTGAMALAPFAHAGATELRNRANAKPKAEARPVEEPSVEVPAPAPEVVREVPAKPARAPRQKRTAKLEDIAAVEEKAEVPPPPEGFVVDKEPVREPAPTEPALRVEPEPPVRVAEARPAEPTVEERAGAGEQATAAEVKPDLESIELWRGVGPKASGGDNGMLWSSPSKAYASSYGTPKKIKVTLGKVLDLREETTPTETGWNVSAEKPIQNWVDLFRSKGVDAHLLDPDYADDYARLWDLLDGRDIDFTATTDLNAALRKSGYNTLIVKEPHDSLPVDAYASIRPDGLIADIKENSRISPEQGKSVPPEVLADYPDLKPKPEPRYVPIEGEAAEPVEPPAPKVQAQKQAAKELVDAALSKAAARKAKLAPKPEPAVEKAGEDSPLAGVKLKKWDSDLLRNVQLEPGLTFVKGGLSIGQAKELRDRGWVEEDNRHFTKKGEDAATAFREMEEADKAGRGMEEYKPGTGRIPSPEETRFALSAPIPHNGEVYHTNGHFLAIGDPPSSWEAPKDASGRLPDIGRILPKASGETVSPIGFSNDQTSPRIKKAVYFSNGKAMDAKYFDYINKLHSPDKWTSEGGDKAFQAWKDGKRVAVVMPARVDTPPNIQKIIPKETTAPRSSSERGSFSLKPIEDDGVWESKRKITEKDKSVWSGAKDLAKRSIDRIAEEGDAGKEIKQRMIDARDLGERKAGTRLESLDAEGFSKLTRDELWQVHDQMRGIAKATSKRAGASAEAGSRVLYETMEDAIKEGATVRTADGEVRPAKHRKNYFPQNQATLNELKKGPIRAEIVENITDHLKLAKSKKQAVDMIDDFREYLSTKTVPESLVQILIDTKQARNRLEAIAKLKRDRYSFVTRDPSLEHAREVNLPFYDPNPARVLPNAILHQSLGAERIAQYGPENRLIDELVAQITDAGGDVEYVKTAVGRILGTINEPDRKLARTASALRAYGTLKMTTSALRNIAQGPINTWIAGDFKAVLEGAKHFTPQGRKFGKRSGAAVEAIMHEIMMAHGVENKFSTNYFNLIQMARTENWNRWGSSLAGADYVARMHKKLRSNPKDGRARDVLERYGLKPDEAIKKEHLDYEELLLAGKKFSDYTQGRSGVQDLPLWASTQAGRLFNQFKPYSYNMGKLLYKEIAGEIKAGRYGRGFAALLVAGTALPFAEDVYQSFRNLITGRDRPEDQKIISRYFQDLMTSAILGNVSDAFQAAQYGRLAEWFIGAVPSSLVRGMEAMVKGPEALGKWAYREIPVIGNTTYNWFFPRKRSPSGDSRLGRRAVRRPTRRRIAR